MNLNRMIYSVPTTEAPIKVVKKGPQRSHIDLADKFHSWKSCMQHWIQEKLYIAHAVSVPWILTPKVRVSRLPPLHIYPHAWTVLLLHNKCICHEKAFVIVSRDTKHIKLVVVLHIYIYIFFFVRVPVSCYICLKGSCSQLHNDIQIKCNFKCKPVQVSVITFLC